MSLKFRSEVRAGNINLGIISILNAFKIMVLNEIAWGVSKDRERIRELSPRALQHLEVGKMKKINWWLVMQEENQERMEGKCFKEGITNCIKCCKDEN